MTMSAQLSSELRRKLEDTVTEAGALNLGGSVETIPSPVAIVELAIEKGATTVLMPISARKQLFSLSDDMATKISIEFYGDPVDAFLKAVLE
jgi:ATP-dependent Lon protease